MRGFLMSYSKAQSIKNPNKFVLRKLVKKYKLLLSFEISNDKDIHSNHFSESKSHVMSSVTEKNCTLKNKTTCRSVKSIFIEHEVKNTMFSLKKVFVIVPIDKAANNVAFIYKHFYALSIMKKLNLDCHLSNQEDNTICTFINDKTKGQIIKEHKL